MAKSPDFLTAPLVVQLTDSHLFASQESRLLGLDTGYSLERVVEQVRIEQPDIDLILASGDLAQDSTLEAYQRFHDATASLAAPARWLPGNHDKVDVMAAFCAGTDLMDPVLDLGAWRLILLDSTIKGAVPGRFEPDQLELLERALSEAPERPTLVSFHHHPVPVGCQWMDLLGLQNPEALFAVLDRFKQVRVVLWGHIHQEYDEVRNGVRLLASPSTGLQFEPGSDDFKVGIQAPGYRWLRLQPDGSLETGISRVEGVDFGIDFNGSGY
ncbi:Icc protein [Pseudomonas duriflava]|uniref:Icc protein n=1 Tax=Pseudomonas duriflava TaxID=459528 RepID=A0A562QBY3_9PSED|nr:3',5'-cyclic-AMP phosphodiesterase [Pseudomonas duriflava]TWI54223.1 Icc protein [Pseudomonas duriflava]